jgi:hypothetical protein
VKRLLPNNFIFLAMSAMLLFAGCETTLEFPEDNLAPKLTIIAHLTSSGTTTPRVFVYASQSPSDSSTFVTPANLDVEVTELETDYSISLELNDKGGEVFFEFPANFLKEGFSYTISAFAPGFESVRATTMIPRPSSIENLVINDVSIIPSTKNEFKNIVRYTLVFDINHFEANQYYHLVFYNQYEGLANAYLVEPELSDEQPFLPHYDFGILIDKEDLVPGEPLSFQFVEGVVGDHDLRRVFVELRTITQEYYKYHSSLARQLIIRQDPFAEPVTIFNNIEGGYGNFSGFSPDISSSDLPE